MEIKVVIPTKGRWSAMTTHNYIANAIICPSQSEEAMYREHCPDVEIVSHPDSVVGLPPKRDWIYKHFKNVFQIDDDVKGLSRMTQKMGEKATLDPETAYEAIQNTGNIAKLCDCYLFGFNSNNRPEFYTGHEPFKMTGCINELGFGMLEGATELKVLPEFTLNYEWYISGLNAFYYRKLLLDMRYCINHKEMGQDTGGVSNQRTNDTERKDTELLIKYFGNAVELKSGKANQNAKRLRIPF